MSACKELIGIGLGPSNLSLAALLHRLQPNIHFLEKKKEFQWHPEIMFKDSTMQTSFLKDLVTPVDPTNPYSFLNYLKESGLFYYFLNTQRSSITRMEYQQYGQWVSQSLGEHIEFETDVYAVDFDGKEFVTQTNKGEWRSRNISVATGKKPWTPECAYSSLGDNVFHAKSGKLDNLNLANKKVVIIGGGQTGVEIFRNALNGKWGELKSLNLVSRRHNLEPLDESAFANDYFTPDYVDQFWGLKQSRKDELVAQQKLTSDGNTPYYLQELYNDMYFKLCVEKDKRDIKILPLRFLDHIEQGSSGYRLGIKNHFEACDETLEADIVILATGFIEGLPPVLEPLYSKLRFDEKQRFIFNKNYSLQWEGPENNKIYALNFSRHNHGIVDPQTSLMAWRSGKVVNDLMGKPVYKIDSDVPCFLNYSGQTKR